MCSVLAVDPELAVEQRDLGFEFVDSSTESLVGVCGSFQAALQR
jgi:hypothetical protein